MHEPVSFFLQQAEQCAKAAAQATLPQLRDRFERSQAAWQALADRKIATIAARDRIAAEKTEPAEPAACGQPRSF